MPRLLLLRHAKSSWADPGVADRDRPLAPRGRRAAERMAAEIVRARLLPDRVLCSPARRTRETLAALQPHLAKTSDIAVADELYESGSGDYIAIIVSRRDGAERLMVIGHNPAIHATALRLIGSGKRKILAQLSAKFPTGALAVIDFDPADWTSMAPASGRLAEFIRPRDLEGGSAAEDD